MRGSRPGERRGGRQKGTPNKKTAYLRAVMAAQAASPNLTSMDVMLAVMRDPHVALEIRVKMALKALPHLHRKLRSGESAPVAADKLSPARQRQKLSPEARRGNELSVGRPVNEAGEIRSGSATTTKEDGWSSVDAPRVASAGLLIAEDGRSRAADLAPLQFLLGVLNDAKAAAAIKVKVATTTLPYTHSRQSSRAIKPSLVADRFGFAVDPALARKLRNEIARLGVLKKRRNPNSLDQKAIQKLNEKIDAKLAMLQCPCPSCYGAKQAATDREKITYLWRKRRSRRKLTPNEDAALAHLNARYSAFAYGPEAQARARLRLLMDKERMHRPANGLSAREEGELRALTILYPPKRPEPNADHEAILEQESMFSDGLFDAGASAEQSVCRTPESTPEPTSEAPAVQPDDPRRRLAPQPEPEEDFVEFVELAPFYTIDRELSARKARLSSSLGMKSVTAN